MKTTHLLCTVVMSAALAACAGTTGGSGGLSGTAAGSQGSAVQLEGSSWQFAGAESGPLAALAKARKITMEFSDGKVYGDSGCNRYFSPYALEGTQLTFAETASTMMLCQDEENAVERAFFDAVKEPLVVSGDATGIRLKTSGGDVLRFVPAKSAAGGN